MSPPTELDLACSELAAVAALIERGEPDDVSLEADVATRHAASIRTALAALDSAPRGAPNWDSTTRGPQMSDVQGRTIFKYQMPVLEQFTMKLPGNAEIIRMESQGGMFWLWAVVDTRAPDVERHFRAFKTGAPIPDDATLTYVGFCAVFVQMELGLYIFEERR